MEKRDEHTGVETRRRLGFRSGAGPGAPASRPAMTARERSAAGAPFRLFFVLAALDAMLGAAAWLPLPLPGSLTAAGWHRDALLFGTIPAMLAGFLLTALPRWTRRPAFPSAVTGSLAALWLCGRAVSGLISPAPGLALACFFILALALLVAGVVLAARDRRDVKVAFLVLGFGVGAVLTAASADIGLRMALASVVGLLAIVGGRVVPALTLAFAGHGGKTLAIRPSPAIELAAAATMTLALCAWVVAPQAVPTALACFLAACTQAVRTAQWRGWRVRAEQVLALHVGYGWIVAGFALQALHILMPDRVDRFAAIHAWMIGAAGTLGLAIMTSMIRKHSGRPFQRQRSATAAFALVTVSGLSRLLAGALPGGPAVWTALSGSAWVAAFGLFLVSFVQLDRASRRATQPL